MNRQKTTIIALMILLSACDFAEPPKVAKKTERKTTQEVAVPLVPKMEQLAGGIHADGLLLNWLVEDDIFAATVEAGDTVTIQVRGVALKPLFSPVYEKKGISLWDGPPYRPMELHRIKPFYRSDESGRVLWTNERPPLRIMQGKCHADFRDYEGEEETEIVFGDNPYEYSLKFRIGEVTYPLGDVIESGEVARLVFNVTAEMVRDSNRLYLTVRKNEPKDVRVGFIRLDRCEGQKKWGFRHGHNTESKIVRGEITDHYIVSLKVEGVDYEEGI